MEAVWKDAVAMLGSGKRFVLASVVSRTGSAPRAVGSMMLVREDGSIISTIGGGEIEGKAIEAAKNMFGLGGWKILSFDLQSTEAAKAGMVCGGTTEILLDVCDRADLPVFEVARQRDWENRKGYLVYRFVGDARSLAFEDEIDLSEEDDSIIRIPMCGNGTLYIFGAGHVALETARIGAMVDFKTVVFDDREEFANARRFPDSQVVVLDSFEELPPLAIDANSYIVIVTRGHIHDAVALDFALGTDAGYVGMIGSRKKRDLTYKSMLEKGHTQERLDQVHSPIGLAIGSETPAEIAVSIVGELIRVRAGKAG